MGKHLIGENGMGYTLSENGLYYPDLEINEEEQPRYGKYGMLRKSYLKNHKKGLYSSYLLTGELIPHLNQVSDEAEERMTLLVGQMAEKQGITEQLKSEDQMLWVQRLNNIRNAAEEIVLQEIVYV